MEILIRDELKSGASLEDSDEPLKNRILWCCPGFGTLAPVVLRRDKPLRPEGPQSSVKGLKDEEMEIGPRNQAD